MKRSLRVLLMMGAVVMQSGTARSEDNPGSQREAKLDVRRRVEMNYLLYLPQEYDTQETWPLVLFLHGAGERGDDLNLVKRHGPPKLIAAGKHFPFIVVSPQCPRDSWWEPVSLIALLDHLAENYKVDPDRVYVTGLSMGGFGTWRLAAYAPERIAAIAPICGGGEKFWARNFSHVPTWAFHGAKDTGVPLERTQMMVDALRDNGGEPKLTVYPEAGHDSWTVTYDNPQLYNWLLQQKRRKSE
jgi:predicted peptidase